MLESMGIEQHFNARTSEPRSEGVRSGALTIGISVDETAVATDYAMPTNPDTQDVFVTNLDEFT